jgi:hypothetical protein
MPAINTLTSTRKNKVVVIADQGKVSRSFVCDAVLDNGTIVKLLSTGKVAVTAAATDVVLGVVTAGNKTAGDSVTVHLVGSAIVRGIASGTVAVGGVVDANGYDATNKLTTFVATTANGNASGVALIGGATTTEIEVLLTKI